MSKEDKHYNKNRIFVQEKVDRQRILEYISGRSWQTWDKSFAKYSDPILWARCPYSGLDSKYSRSFWRAAIMLTCLLISACERFTIPTHGCWSLYALPSSTLSNHRSENRWAIHYKTWFARKGNWKVKSILVTWGLIFQQNQNDILHPRSNYKNVLNPYI